MSGRDMCKFDNKVLEKIEYRQRNTRAWAMKIALSGLLWYGFIFHIYPYFKNIYDQLYPISVEDALNLPFIAVYIFITFLMITGVIFWTANQIFNIKSFWAD